MAAPFTDEDLKRLKEELERSNERESLGTISPVVVMAPHLAALVARLEAAERVLGRYPSFVDSFPEYMEWLRQAGKDVR